MRAGHHRLARIATLGATLAAIAGAFGASLALGTASLGGASTTAARCTAAGLSVLQNLSGTNVVSVTVGNLPSTCGGATLQAAVSNGSTSSTGSATVPSGGGSVVVTLGAAVALAAADETDLVLTGP